MARRPITTDEIAKPLRRNMDEELHALRNGEITQDEFVRRTEAHWNRLTKVTFARWDLPAAIEPEDIKQELLLKALEPKPMSGKTLLEKFDPKRAIKLGRYVVFNALSDVNKELQRQRQRGHYPLRVSDLRTKSRFTDIDQAGCATYVETILNEFGDGDLAHAEDSSENQLMARELLRRASSQMDEQERLALRALFQAEGDADEAATIIEQSIALSLKCSVSSPDEARALVARAIERVKRCRAT